MDCQRKDGSTLRANLQQAERSTGKKLIDEPEIAHCGAHLWEWFWELNAARAQGFSGPNPIGYQDIQAWAALTGTTPHPWETRALKAMDRAFLAAVDKISS